MTTVTATLEITSPDGTKRTVTLPPWKLDTIPSLGFCVGFARMLADGPMTIDVSEERQGRPVYEQDVHVRF
jgi:hypothetical protein